MAKEEQQNVNEEKEEEQPLEEAETAEDGFKVDDAGEETEEQEDNRLIQLENEVNEWKNKTLRVQADLENFRRRAKEERETAAKYKAQSLVESLLPALDNFERALQIEPDGEEAKSLLQGMNMVYSQLKEALENEGVEVIQTEGQQFDPNLHQAVMQVEEAGFETNEIVEELQKGYKLKDRIIRPSMVKVNA
ncbi:nucleotide exchange factor GrpE [Thalassorhabdus alkalitolerans]|uniref:Protein GrpE n=1 Tax=Thalassorhabdus alkalitolerans TaxID=2282697 RepID=A0ABW0YSU9_9BACI|nr:nucleotide exchange factor GrpE [Thalassobacillus sp. C254]